MPAAPRLPVADAGRWRLALVRVAAGEQRLLLCLNHMISDGWSVRVLLQEFRYSLKDLDSTRFGESAGTSKVAVATRGLPRASSQDSS